jgi:hypothetical protein
MNQFVGLNEKVLDTLFYLVNLCKSNLVSGAHRDYSTVINKKLWKQH